ncbi:uncharacterized protein LOC125026207 [Penaeus chinensis]|uniref:uncharacterized protein LOC125026207 n=1 Tax=Penaeus chinensis TaxID=139456 RepID=UPI001FB6917E|nr:uncharacterized protein LOC125026207 [Penaeus chinensis]
MSLFGSLLSGFDDDPFFGGPRSIMRQMDRMMSSMIRDPFQDDPFFASGHEMSPFPALTAGPVGGARHHQSRAVDRDPFALAIPNMTNIMSSMLQVGPLPLPQEMYAWFYKIHKTPEICTNYINVQIAS